MRRESIVADARRRLLQSLMLLTVTATVAQAQTAAARLAATRDGTVRFTFTLRPGVCGTGQNIWRTGRGTSNGVWLDKRGRDDVEYDVECDSGPGRVVIDRAQGRTTDVRLYIGGRWRSSSAATDLGALGAREASELLLDIVRRADGKAGERAIHPLILIDSIDVSRELIAVARDTQRPTSTRKQAVFWMSQAAEERATAGLKELVGEAALDRDVREQAIFALSQRPKEEGVPALINIVKTNRDPELRRKALFWLGQSGDPRALDLIEELLTRR
jgi:hypothetical protein